MKYLATIDFGTSCIKASLIPVVDGPDIDQLTAINLDSMFFAPSQSQNGFPYHLHALEFPEEYFGIVGTAVKDIEPVNCGILRTSNIVDRREFGMGCFYALALLLEKASTLKDVTIEQLAIGFPASHQSAFDAAKALLVGTFPVHISDKKNYSVTIEDVISRSQGYYVALDQISHWTRNSSGVQQLVFDRAKTLIESGQMLTMVHGSNTLEVVLLSSTLHEAAQDNFKFGTYNHLRQLRALAHAKIGADLTNYELMFQLFPTGKITYEQQEYDLNDEINAMVRKEYEVLADQAFHSFLDTHMARPVICISAGGGSIRSLSFLQEFYAKKFPVQLAVDDNGDPETILSVRRGMEKLLVVEYARRAKNG